jgi:hypothetical protein
MYGMKNRLGRVALCLAAGLASAAPALAQEFQPYPSPKITVEQYVNYAKKVQESLGDSAEILQGMNLVAFSDMRTRTFYIFTTKDHPAHPAWITRQMDEEGGQVHVKQIGYFAARKRNSPSYSATTRNGMCSSRKKSSAATSSVGCPFSGFRICPTPRTRRIA